MPARSKKNHRPKKNQLGSFRVIGGEWRSRRLEFPVVEGLRPTTDRVRETLFNWIMPQLPGAKVLDLFAGSGSLGIEALSRGAAYLTAIERDTNVAQAIKSNLNILNGIHQADIINCDALSWLDKASFEGIELIFLDPPFRTNLLDDALKILEQKRLDEGTLLYLELEKEKQSLPIPESWILKKEKQAGQVSYRLYAVVGINE